jgi:colicin import membrane protein
VIRRQAEAGALCAKEVPARQADARRLRDEAAEAEAQRHELERDFDPASWGAVADNLPRARHSRESADAQLKEAEAASAREVQHYFRAVKLLEQAGRQQGEARSLLLAVGQSLRQLGEVRQECQRRRQEVGDLARRAQAFLTSHNAIVRPGARSRFDAAEESWRRVRGEADGPRPHWPNVRQHIEEAQKGYAAAQKEAEEDVRSHQQLMAKLDEAGREAERVGLLLRQHYQARAGAQQARHAAVDALERVRQQSAGRGADWPDLLRQVEEAAKGLARAEQLAREDVRLAERAEGAIAEAERELERARGHQAMGIMADVGRAVDVVTQARRRLAAQEYEAAAEQAGAAAQAARQAHDEAARRAQQEQQRQAAAAAMPPPAPAPLMSSEPPPRPIQAEADDPNAEPENPEYTS